MKAENELAAPIELLPCPFCGGRAEWADGEQKHKYGNDQAYCTNCFAVSAPDLGLEAAAAWWNARPAPDVSGDVREAAKRAARALHYVPDLNFPESCESHVADIIAVKIQDAFDAGAAKQAILELQGRDGFLASLPKPATAVAEAVGDGLSLVGEFDRLCASDWRTSHRHQAVVAAIRNALAAYTDRFKEGMLIAAEIAERLQCGQTVGGNYVFSLDPVTEIRRRLKANDTSD